MIFSLVFSFLFSAVSFAQTVAQTAPTVQSPIRVVVTLPDFVFLVEQIGAQEVSVESLLDGREDPHFVDALPSFVSRIARADLLCFAGLELEVGWLPRVIEKAANPRLKANSSGLCDLSEHVATLEKSAVAVDRSQGDVHAHGNPHYNLSLAAMAKSGEVIATRLALIRPEKKVFFNERLERLKQLLLTAQNQVAAILAPVRGLPLFQYHKHFSYFFHEYGLQNAGTIEDRPGVPPSAARLAAVSREAQTKKVALALGDLHSPERHLKRFSELSGVPFVMLPTTVQRHNPQADDPIKLQKLIATSMVEKILGTAATSSK